MIELVNVQKRYGARVALDIPALTIQPGKRFALIGPNGSGKSTLLRLLAGVIAPEAGNVQSGELRRGEIGYLPQQPYAFDLSVQQNVELSLSGEPEKAKRALDALERVIRGQAKRLVQQENSGDVASRITATCHRFKAPDP